ncbi:MAG: acyl-CoA dehydrogenase family protein [Elusimicrobiota bacterium]
MSAALVDAVSLDKAKDALGSAELTQKAVAAHLANVCSVHGQLAVEKIDEHQLAAYDLSFIAAEILAAKFFLALAESGGGEIERRLAVFFTAECLADISARVSFRLVEFGLGADSWRPQAFAEWAGQILSPEFYAATARVLGQRFPSFGLSPEQEEIRLLFRRFAETRVKPLAEKIHREDLLVPESIVKELAEMGCFGLSIPQRYGGFQDDAKPDNLSMCLATEELSRVSLGGAGSLVTRPEILAKALLKGGAEEQRAKWLPMIAAGQKMVCVAATEPDYGSDVAGITLKAVEKDGAWILQGLKTWCTFAGRAEILLVLARTDPDRAKKHKGLSLFIVEKPAFDARSFEHVQPGGGKISGRQIPCIGYRGMHTFEVVFDDYRVPLENLVGGREGLGRGFYLQMEGFAGGRLQTAARANGVSLAALEEAFNYALNRKVFGKPVFEFQLTQWKLVRMAAWLAASRQLSYQVARLFDQGRGQMEASLAKLLASRISEWITREATQIHGAMGYAEEAAVSRYFVDGRVFSIFEGAEEILALRVIAKTLLEEALKKGQ